jgi:signal transduction histidine kinase
MSLSIAFSSGIYLIATNELQAKLNNFRTSIKETLETSRSPNVGVILHASDDLRVSNQLVAGLFYINLFMLAGGGLVSYLLARRSLSSIENLHEAQSRFTSDASHELKTPLAVMKMELEVALKDKNATKEDLRNVLSSNLEEVDKLSNLSEMLLSLSRLDSAELKFKVVNLNKVIKSVACDYKTEKDRIRIDSKKQQVIYGNETAVFDLIKVLIDNAIKYSPKNTPIGINLSSQDNTYARLDITNEGPGIKADRLPYIFDRFYRVDSSRTNTSNKGYGLGLALAKNITELHDGKISAKSTPNRDTTFTLLLPLNSAVKKKNKTT